MRPKPLDGYTYVYSIPEPMLPNKRNASCIVFSTTSDEVAEGMTVLVDMINVDFRPLVVSGVQVYIVPNDAILAILL